MRHRYARLDISIGLVALVYAGLTAALFSAPLPRLSLWNGYYMLLVSRLSGEAEVDAKLLDAGFRVVSPASTTVSFTDFGGLATASVEELQARLDPLDPRLDPYMRGLSRYFHAGAWDIRYLAADRSVIGAALRLSGALRGYVWRLADVSPERGAICLAALFAGAALFMIRNPHHGVLYLLGALPWLPLALIGTHAASVISPTAYCAWGFVTEGFASAAGSLFSYGTLDGDESRRKIAAGAGLLLAAAAASVDQSWELALLPTAADCALWAGALVLIARSQSHRVHRLFVPLGLMNGVAGFGSRGVRRGATLVALAVIIVAAQVGLALVPALPVPVPVPKVLPGAAGWSWASLSRLDRDHEENPMPNLADFLSHRAYQASLAYGRPYRFPSPNERVVLPTYARSGQHIVERNVTVLQFTREWYARQLRSVTGISRLLAEQPRPTATVTPPVGRGPLAEARFLLYALLCFGAFLPFVVSPGGFATRSLSVKRSIGLRRREQAA